MGKTFLKTFLSPLWIQCKLFTARSANHVQSAGT